MPTPPNPAPKGRKKTAQDKVQDASPDEVLGNPRKKIQAPQGAKQIKPDIPNRLRCTVCGTLNWCLNKS